MLQLAKNERVEMMVRKHWFILFSGIFFLLLIFLAPFAIYAFIQGQTASFAPVFQNFKSPDSSLLIFLSALWFLLVWMRLFAIWTDYYLDVWIITDKRIIDIDQRGFFSRKMSSFRLEQIQDVTIDIHGLIRTILDFGNIHVQTAGESQQFLIRGIPNPRHVKEYILRMHDSVVEKKNIKGI